LRCPLKPAHHPIHLTGERSTVCEREGYCEVVQWSQRVWLHPAFHRRRRVRALLRHPGERLPLAERRRDGGVRPAKGPQGFPGGERRPRVTLSNSKIRPLAREGFFIEDDLSFQK